MAVTANHRLMSHRDKYGEMSSDVMSRIMAVTARHKLMSHRDNGKSKALFLYDQVAGFYDVAVFRA